MRRGHRWKKGFTLVELVTVIALLGVLAAVAAPSVVGFVQSGQQTNRSNVARTLYVAAQSRLTELRVSRNLRPTLTEQYYLQPGSSELDPDKLELDSLSVQLDTQFPAADMGNKPYVRYITKPLGAPTAENPVVKLLDPVVVDKSLLHNAICIEYNIQTGVVLSVFYSESAPQLIYDSTDTVDPRTNIWGSRPYTLASDRKQGYYGVDSTGAVYLPPLPDEVQIYDGGVRPLENTHTNVLYAEIFLPHSTGTVTRTLALTAANKSVLCDTGALTMPAVNGTLASGLNLADTGVNGGHILYRTGAAPLGSVVQYNIDLSAAYDRYIWVIDYVEGDQFQTKQKHNLPNKYKLSDGKPIPVQELRVRVSAADSAVISLSKANSLYQSQSLGGHYSVATGRHLSNVRYSPDGEFRQSADISLQGILNFEPIPTFSGNYIAVRDRGASYRISGLNIDTTDLTTGSPASVGLFGTLNGGKLHGISLDQATIKTTGSLNVGSLAGELTKGEISHCNSLSRVEALGNGNMNVGGLVGLVGKEGRLEQSYNGGYYDATGRDSASVPGFGYLYGARGNIGGLVGQNMGAIWNCYNNARVNITDALVETSGPDQWLSKKPTSYTLLSGRFVNAGGIAGYNSGSIKTCYATNHVANYVTPSRCGGIVGNSSGKVTNCFYLNNGISNAYGVNRTKAELQTALLSTGSAFAPGAVYTQGRNGSDSYPYPVLRNNRHMTGYEDIWEKPAIAPVWLSYYEYYLDNSWGYRYAPVASPGIPPPAQSLRDTQPVVAEGYCLDLGYNAAYDIVLNPGDGSGAVTYQLTDPTNNPDAPAWQWRDPPPELLLPVSYSVQDGDYTETRYRLVLSNKLLEDMTAGQKPLTITVNTQNATLLTVTFDPRFAEDFDTDTAEYLVRSPRHLDNVDLCAVGQNDEQPPVVYDRFVQQLDLDFWEYYKELNAEDNTLLPQRESKLVVTGSTVNARFAGDYDGGSRFIRNMQLLAVNDDSPDNHLTGRGLFAEVSGVVHDLALLSSDLQGDSSGSGGRALGGIAGVVTAEDKDTTRGKIERCELSQVTVRNLGWNACGGIAGINAGTITNVYFNAALRDPSTGMYQSPISGNPVSGTGGLVGINLGRLTNSYNNAIGPNGKPTVGIQRAQDAALTNVYYLSTSSYNADAPTGNGWGIALEPGSWQMSNLPLDRTIWADGSRDTTKATELCLGMGYQFPRLKGMDHYYDWPLLVPSLKYYERYSDLSYGYYYLLGTDSSADNWVDTLRYDPDLTVIEDGYLLEVQSTADYTVRFFVDGRGNYVGELQSLQSTLMDGRLVIKLPHDAVEPLVRSDTDVVSAKGIRPLRIQASSAKNGFANELIVNNSAESGVWFNPLFAKSIYLTSTFQIPQAPGTTLEVRSPRQLLNIDRFRGNSSAHAFMTGYQYRQTISLNMAARTLSSSSTRVVSRSDNEYSYGSSQVEGGPPRNLDPTWSFEQTSGTTAIITSPEVLYSQNGSTSTYRYTTVNISRRRNSTNSTWSGAGNNAETLYERTEIAGSADPDGRPYYSRDPVYSTDSDGLNQRTPLEPVGRNAVTNLRGSYDGSCAGAYTGQKDPLTGRLAGYNIYSLTMNVPAGPGLPYNMVGSNRPNGNALRYEQNTGGAFGDMSGTVSNLNFVDPQLRYAENGMGGGIVANINSGVIHNVTVSNTQKRQLFTNAAGGVDTMFCARTSSTTELPSAVFSHAHGGIAGVTTGRGAQITDCIVGTNSPDIDEIVDNKVQMTCYSGLPNVALADTSPEYNMGMMGGITGVLTDYGSVLRCTNIATIQPNISAFGGYNNSVLMIGGIVGRIGNADRGYVNNKPGIHYSPGDIAGCYNAGTITMSSYYVGGIVGRTAGILKDADYSRVSSCYNTGRINAREVNGVISAVPYNQNGSNTPLRLGGICGESDATKFQNCYNIGYVSNQTGSSGADSSGAIVGLPTYGNNIVEYCYSLAAGDQQLRPDTIVGKELYRGASINGIADNTQFVRLFGDYWESRAKLRENDVMTNPSYVGKPYPAIPETMFSGKTGAKDYFTFVNSAVTDRLYIYPQFPGNPHITPFEYIDSMYETTLKYYERYADGSAGSYYMDLQHTVQNTLRQDAAVTEEGYYLEIGKAGFYTVEINDTAVRDIAAVADTHGQPGRFNIPLTDAVLALCKPGTYNKLRVYTQLYNPGNPNEQALEDDKLNRIVGSRSVLGTPGIDLYFDPYFPQELVYSTLGTDGTTFPAPVRPAEAPYRLRSPRQLENIGLLTAATPNLTANKVFQQELNLDFTAHPYTHSVVRGTFLGSYNGGGKTISNLTITGGADDEMLGLFEQNRGTISNLALTNLNYTSDAAATLTMGSVAGVNAGGTIKNVAVSSFALTGSATASNQQLGGIVGVNAGGSPISRISGVYLVSTDPVSPISSPAAATLGGIVGNNQSSLTHSLYLAVAPNTNPVSGTAITGAATSVDVYYLGGTGCNNFDVGDTGGLAKSTNQLTALRDKLSQDWKTAGWEVSLSYPYPSLKGLTPPTDYPTANDISFGLAYRETYGDMTEGWYYGADDPRNKLDDAKPITATDYLVTVPPEYSDQQLIVRLNGIAVPDVPLPRTAIPLPAYYDPAMPSGAVRVTVNGFDMANGLTYCDRAFGKALGTTPNLTHFAIRTPEQMLQIGKMSLTEGKAFDQERDLDFGILSLSPLGQSVVTGEFRGTYNGNGKTIANLHIESADDNVGIFSVNSGKLNNVALGVSSLIVGGDNVGGIAGHNTVTGVIAGGSVVGYDPITSTGGGLKIAGQRYVGGLAGYNEGSITSSTVLNLTGVINDSPTVPAAISAAVDYAGGFAGLNDTTGRITGCMVDYVSIGLPATGQFCDIMAPNLNLGHPPREDNNNLGSMHHYVPERIATMTVLLEGRRVAEQPLISPQLGELTLLVDRANPVPGASDVQPHALLPGFSGLFHGLTGAASGFSALPPGVSGVTPIPPQEVLLLLDDVREGYALTGVQIADGNSAPLQVIKLSDESVYRFVARTTQSNIVLTFTSLDDSAAHSYTCTIGLHILA